MAQYAVDNGNGKIASDDVDQCLRYIAQIMEMMQRSVGIYCSGSRILCCTLRYLMLDYRSCLLRKYLHLKVVL